MIEAIAGAANAVKAPSWPEALPGPHSAYIPNVIVRTHHNLPVRFYDDLIRQKIVMINCMAIRDEASCSNIEILAQVQPLIGEELGRSVFLYSITTDPVHDTPAALRAFAEKYNASNGWLFLTGKAADLKVIRQRLFIHSGGMHLIRYGNEAVGLWGGVPSHAMPGSIAQRLSWITPVDRPAGAPKRGGPPPLNAEG
jgi:protein SCO1/2